MLFFCSALSVKAILLLFHTWTVWLESCWIQWKILGCPMTPSLCLPLIMVPMSRYMLLLFDCSLICNWFVMLFILSGWSLGEHGEWAKYSNFDVATRVPLMFYVPGVTRRGQPQQNVFTYIDPLSYKLERSIPGIIIIIIHFFCAM